MKTNPDTMIYEILNSLTRKELRSLAVSLGVPRGRNKRDTEKNLEQAIHDGKAKIKALVYISEAPKMPNTRGRVISIKTFHLTQFNVALSPTKVLSPLV